MMGYKTVGNTLAEWEDAIPFVFTLSEEIGEADARRSVTITLDLSDLQKGFGEGFLLYIKDLIIEWRHRVTLSTLETYSRNLHHLFRRVNKLNLFDKKINIVDEAFLLILETVKDELTETQLKTFKMLYLAAPHSPLWGPFLNSSFFPRSTNIKGERGRQISRILAKALTRSACVHILSQCEQAYDLGEMDIGLFAFINLAFAVFCRPESYRQIQLGDLIFDKETNTYFLRIIPTKTRVLNPKKICYRINEPLGLLLQKQRQNVVHQYSHLVHSQDVHKLALFPANGLNSEKSAWSSSHANKNFGMHGRSETFSHAYGARIQKLFISSGITIGANVLRHTVGTQLAQTGASAQTIQAVLKHATDRVCTAYVDIAFRGLIETLSDTMQPAFNKHFPVFTRFRSKNDPIELSQAIRVDDLETGKIEMTGECGKLIQCDYAPITCYGCLRFIPCWDADHTVNLSTVQREIEDYKRRGKPFQHLIESAQIAKYQIILVMNAADRYRQAHNLEIDNDENHPI